MTPLEPVQPLTEQPHSGDQVAQDARERAIRLAATGALLGANEMSAIFGIGLSGFHRNAKRGLYDQFKVQPPLGPRCYSGFLVTLYVRGERVATHTFGRKALRHGR